MAGEDWRRCGAIAEFLEWDNGSDRRCKMLDGQPVAMPLMPEAHGSIVGDLFAELRSRLQAPCRDRNRQ